VSQWPSSKASRVYKALLRIGWKPPEKLKSGSHIQLTRDGVSYSYTWAFHDGDDIGPKMLARIAKKTGLKPEDL
jgi:predicted RNA binding protein YcfA (HicA-like mRNA interferase family)